MNLILGKFYKMIIKCDKNINKIIKLKNKDFKRKYDNIDEFNNKKENNIISKKKYIYPKD